MGLRPDIKLMAISENEYVQKNILSIIQYATDVGVDAPAYESKWDDMDKLHYKRWVEIKGEYTSNVKEECDYRIEQLSQSFHQRELIIRGMIQNATDEKIIRMRTSQLNKLKVDYENQERTMQETISKADIHTNLLIKGVLHVE